MSGWESLFNTAAVEYSSGNFKDSYSNYLKAANALLYKFGHEVAFANRETVTSKPVNSTRLFQQLKFCVQRLEDILQNRAINGVPPISQLSAISDNAALNLTNSHPMHLPLVPFSPLTRQSIHHAHFLAVTSQQLSVANQKSPDIGKDSEGIIRKLKDEVRQRQNKLDQVNNQIQSIAEDTLLHWDAEAVSLQLTIIDSSLFNKVDFKRDFSAKDKKNSKVQACMDFHRYLTNNFAHQFIYADMTRTSVNSLRGTQHPRESIIPHAVRIAYYLLNVHRNFNSFAALMKALTSPEVRRIRRLWTNLPAHTTKILKELSSYVKKDNDYKAYREKLAQKLDSFRGVGQGTIVIPWMQPGALKLTSIFSLLEQCKTNTMAHDDEEWNEVRKHVTSSQRHRDTITVDGITITIPSTLSCLGCGDLGLHHWLVSRVYLTKQQLIDESIEIEPLGESEQLPCVENEEEEEEEDDDHASVGQYDIGSDDGGDNMEIGTSSKHVFASNSAPPLTKVSQNNSGEQSNETLESLDTPSSIKDFVYTSSNEQTIDNSVSTSVTNEISKTVENGKTVGKSLEEETSYNLETVKNDSASGFSNGKSEGPSTFSSKTSPISIPQQSQKEIQPILSPPKNLNPNAPVFIPQSLNSLNSSLLSGDKINISLKQLEEMKKNRDSGNESSVNKDENDEEFVYPKSDEDEFVYDVKDGKDSDDEFLYEFSSNDEMVFPHDISSNNKKDNVAKNGINSVITATKVGNTENSNVPEITVKVHGNTVSKVN